MEPSIVQLLDIMHGQTVSQDCDHHEEGAQEMELITCLHWRVVGYYGNAIAPLEIQHLDNF